MIGRPVSSTTRNKIYLAIVEFWKIHGYSPSIRDLSKMTDIKSTAHINHHLTMLERQGLIKADYKVSRSIVLVGAQWIPPDFSRGLLDPSPPRVGRSTGGIC